MILCFSQWCSYGCGNGGGPSYNIVRLVKKCLENLGVFKLYITVFDTQIIVESCPIFHFMPPKDLYWPNIALNLDIIPNNINCLAWSDPN
jgi:hypothetical protein